MGLTKRCIYHVTLKRKLNGYVIAYIEDVVVEDGRYVFVRRNPCICEYSNIKKFNENWNGPMYDDEIATLDLEIASVVPEAYNGYSSELFSEQLTYTWTVQVDENPSRFLTNDDVGTIIESGLGTPTLVVKNPAGLNRYTFKCIISNTLNGKTVTSSEAEALPFYVM